MDQHWNDLDWKRAGWRGYLIFSCSAEEAPRTKHVMAVLHQDLRLSPVLPGPKVRRRNPVKKLLGEAHPSVWCPRPCSSQPFAILRATRPGPCHDNYNHNKSHYFFGAQGEAAWPLHGYQLAALHAQMVAALSVHMLRTGAVCISGRRKLRAPARKAFGEPQEV